MSKRSITILVALGAGIVAWVLIAKWIISRSYSPESDKGYVIIQPPITDTPSETPSKAADTTKKVWLDSVEERIIQDSCCQVANVIYRTDDSTLFIMTFADKSAPINYFYTTYNLRKHGYSKGVEIMNTKNTKLYSYSKRGYPNR